MNDFYKILYFNQLWHYLNTLKEDFPKIPIKELQTNGLIFHKLRLDVPISYGAHYEIDSNRFASSSGFSVTCNPKELDKAKRIIKKLENLFIWKNPLINL